MVTSFYGKAREAHGPLHSTCVRRSGHRRTDPACRFHRAPRTRFAWWLFNRNHGRGCVKCIQARRFLRNFRAGVV